MEGRGAGHDASIRCKCQRILQRVQHFVGACGACFIGIGAGPSCSGQVLVIYDALGIQRAFRRFAPRKLRRHIDDVMRTQKNAVLLWTVTPPTDEMNKAFGCLKG